MEHTPRAVTQYHLMPEDLRYLTTEQRLWLEQRETEIDPMFHYITYELTDTDETWVMLRWPDLEQRLRLPSVWKSPDA